MNFSLFIVRLYINFMLILFYLAPFALVFNVTMAHANTVIIPDGRTLTTVNNSGGGVHDVTTGTVANQVGYNTFKQFDVSAGNVANIHVPDGAHSVVNLVNGKASDINGQVNALRNGSVGGNMYFYNPDGILVGKEGSFNATNVTLGTPSREFVEGVVSSNGQVDPAAAEKALTRNFPLSKSGAVELHGKIQAQHDAYIVSQKTTIGKDASLDVKNGLKVYNSVKKDFEKVVNVGADAGAQGVTVDASGALVIGGETDVSTTNAQLVNGNTEQTTTTTSTPVVASFGAVTQAAETPSTNPAIVASSKTKTKVTSVKNGDGWISTVETESVAGNNAYNAFDKFSVFGDDTVNLYVPTAVDNLINLVYNEQTRIDGVLNAYKDGRIGGNVYFLNPNGLVVGAAGVINVGRLTVATPTLASLNGYLNQALVSPQYGVSAIVSLPANVGSIVSIQGAVSVLDGININAGDIVVSGGLTVAGGAIQLVAKQDVLIDGAIIDVSDDVGQSIIIRADRNVLIRDDSRILAKGTAQGAAGGKIDIDAKNKTYIGNASLLNVDGSASGKGGAIKLSATNVVHLDGGSFSAGADSNGVIKISSKVIDVAGNVCLGCGGSGKHILDATSAINLAENVFISTRQIEGSATDKDSYLSASSVGDSGTITLKAPRISLASGSALIAHATDDFKAGNVSLSAKSETGALNTAETRIGLGSDVQITGADVSLQAESTGKTALGIIYSGVSASSEINLASGVSIDATGELKIQSKAEAEQGIALYSLVSIGDADSSISIDDATLNSSGALSINAESSVTVAAKDYVTDYVPTIIPVDFAFGVGVSDASIDIKNSSIESSDDSIDVGAKSTVEVESISTARVNGVNDLLPSAKFGGAIAVGVLENHSTVSLLDSSLIAGQDVTVSSWSIGKNETTAGMIADSQAGFGLGVGFSWSNQSADITLKGTTVTAENNVNIDNQNVLKNNLTASVEITEDQGLSGLTEIIDSILDIIKENVSSIADEAEEKERACVLDEESDACGKTTKAEKIDDWGSTVKSGIEVLDAAAALSEKSEGENSNADKNRRGVAIGGQISINSSVTELSASDSAATEIEAKDGDLDIHSTNMTETNALVSASVEKEEEVEGDTYAYMVGGSFDKNENNIYVGGEVNNKVQLSANSISIVTDNSRESEEGLQTVAGEEIEVDASGIGKVENKRSLMAVADADKPIGVAIGFSLRDTLTDIDHASLNVNGGDLTVSANQELSNLDVTIGDSEEEADLAETLTGLKIARGIAELSTSALGKVDDYLKRVNEDPKEEKPEEEEDIFGLVTSANIGLLRTKAIVNDDVRINEDGGELENLEVSATSTIESMLTRAKTEADQANAIGLAFLNDNTIATLGGVSDDEIIATGDVTVSANHASNIETDISATDPKYLTLGGSIVNQNTESFIKRDVDAEGGLEITAESLRRVESSVDGAAEAAEEEEEGGEGSDLVKTGQEALDDAGMGYLAELAPTIFSAVEKAVTARPTEREKQAENKGLFESLSKRKDELTESIKEAKKQTDKVAENTPDIEGVVPVEEEEEGPDYVLTPGFNVVITDTNAKVAAGKSLSASTITVSSLENLDSTVEVNSGALGVAANVVVNDNIVEIGAGASPYAPT
jgi:filamentous hemagglutinin family protein